MIADETEVPVATQAEPSPPPALVQYLDGLVAKLLGHAADVLATEQIDSVHQARVATRRLKAALDLLRPVLAEKTRRAMSRTLRRVRRRLGPVRDIDVMVSHLHDLSDAVGEEQPIASGVGWLTEQLEHDRLDAMDDARCDRTVLRLATKLRAWRKVRTAASRRAGEIDALIRESLHRQSDAFAAVAGNLSAPGQGDASGVDVDPHAVRIAGKALRYTVEMAQAHGHPLPEEITKSFKRMQDALGLWHDYVVLSERAMITSAEAMLAHHNIPLQQGVLDVARRCTQEASRQLDQFSGLWRENGASLMEAIRGAYAPAEDVTGSQTGRDPGGLPSPTATEGPH